MTSIITPFVSSLAFAARNIEALLAEARAADIRNLELTAGLRRCDNLRTRLEEAARSGFRFVTHNYFPPPTSDFVLNLASEDAEAVAQSIAIVREALAIASAVGAPFHSVHAGFAVPLTPELLGRPDAQSAAFAGRPVDRSGAYARMVAVTSTLAADAADLGLDLLIENNVLAPETARQLGTNPFLLVDAEESCRFVADVAASNVGLLVDVGHVKVSATALGFDPVTFLDKVASHVRALHLSDNDGQRDSNGLISEESWFIRHLPRFADRAIVIETYGGTAADLARQRALVVAAATQPELMK